MDRRSGQERRSLTGAQKAAALLITMGRDSAVRLLKHLDPADVRDITRAAATLGLVEGRALAALIDDFALELAEGPKVIGDLAQAESIASASLPPEEVSGILEDLSGGRKLDAWTLVREAGDARLLAIMDTEPAQIVAFVLGKIDANRTARLCELMSEERRADVLARMLVIRSVSAGIQSAIEAALLEILCAPAPDDGAKQRPAMIANILNQLEPSKIDAALDSLAKVAPSAAEAVRSLVFKFEDVAGLTQQARSALFDSIPTERVVLALKGADEAVREAVMSALGARARRMVESELAGDSPAPAKEIAAARRLIADTALRLSEAGTISLSGSVSA